MKHIKLFFWILILIGSVPAAQSACELKLKKQIVFPTKDHYAGPIYMFSDNTIYFNRQNTREHILMNAEGSYQTFSFPQRLIKTPSRLKNGNLLFSAQNGQVLEMNSKFEIVNSVTYPIKGYFDSVVEWGNDSWFLTKTDGKILQSKPFDSQFVEVFDLNATNSDPEDPNYFFQGAVNYQNQYLIINPGYDDPIAFLSPQGNKVFEFNDVAQNVFQDPLILKSGKVLAWGFLPNINSGLLSVVDPKDGFKEEKHYFKDVNPIFVTGLKNGGFVMGAIALNESRTSYDNHLIILDAEFKVLNTIVTLQSGFDLTWKAVELADGHIINGVRDIIQLISPEYKLVSQYQLPNVEAGRNYQAVDGAPVVLKDETVVYLGDSTEVYFMKKECSK
jgi:hypothetical protein